MKLHQRIAQVERVGLQLVTLTTLPGARAPKVIVSGSPGAYQLLVVARDDSSVLERYRAGSLLDLLEVTARDVEQMRAVGLWWHA